MLLFGLATVRCWAHYGIVSVKYLTRKRFSTPTFIVIYSLAVLFGSVISADIIWGGADFSIGAMTIINVVVLIMLSGEVKRETEDYFGSGKTKK